ncbi:MAG: RNA polymerase sigma factor [Limisphaerales bacterium]
MPDSDDITLLKQYADGDESAFTLLVERYVHLVYSVAMRQVCNPSHAEEITQAVFIILTQKAKSFSPKTILSGWLYQTARLTAANLLRSENRRQQREQEVYMQSTLTEPDPVAWEQMASSLDEAMGRLGEADRNAIILRFFENKTPQEVAAVLKLNEVAARKRMSRALEKLRKFFIKRGITLSAAVVAGAVSANSVQAAPIGLAATISTTAIKGSAVAASTLTLIKGTMKTMTWLKLKFAIGVGTALLLAGGVAIVAVSQTSSGDKLTPQEIAKQSQAAYAALSSYSDNGKVTSEVGGQSIETTFSIRLQRPNSYRIDWTQTGGFYTSKGIVWSDGTGNYFEMGAAGQVAKPRKMQNMRMALASATGVSALAAATIPATFFKQNWGNVLGFAASGRSKAKVEKENDEKIGDVDCYVISSTIDPASLPNQGQLPDNRGKIGTTTTTLWIGRQDYLIHQTQTILEGATFTMPSESDSDIKGVLEKQNKPATPEAIAAMRAQLDTMMKQTQSALKSGKYVFTQTHENIVVNQKFSTADFGQ